MKGRRDEEKTRAKKKEKRKKEQKGRMWSRVKGVTGRCSEKYPVIGKHSKSHAPCGL